MDAWDQFPDVQPAAHSAAGADPWAQFPDATPANSGGPQNGRKYVPAPPPARPKTLIEMMFPETEAPTALLDPMAAQNEGIANTLPALAEPLMSMGSGMLATPVAGIVGATAAPFVGGSRAAELIRRVQEKLTYQPRTDAGQQTTAAVSYPFEKLAQGANWAGENAAQITGSPALGAGVNAAVQTMPALLARGTVRSGRVSVNRPSPPMAAGEAEAAGNAAATTGRAAGLERVPAKSQPPSIEELTAAKNAAYKTAEDTGVVISRSALNRLKVEMVNDLKKEGLNKTLHPKTTAAIKEIVDTKGQLSLSQIETLRKIANDAKGAIEPADARLGAKIVDHIDDFEANLAEGDVVSGNASAGTAFKQARALNTRLSKAKEIEALIERAKISAPNFSGSGLENALRTEFRALAKNANKMRRFTPEEQAAIKKVAIGGPMENILRQVGKLAPTGVVSLGMGSLGGFALGGPTGAAMAPMIGTASRIAATRMTKANAENASALMRSGPGNALIKQRKPEAVTP